MSATSASTSTSPGKCVVCGKETWMRCSACSTAGLDWMCFCSIEHQKLIWFMHRRVCGERSNPFRFPGLNTEEIEGMMGMSERPFKERGQVSNWLEEMDYLFKWSKNSEIRQQQFRSYLESLNDINIDKPFFSKAIIAHRSLAHGYRLAALAEVSHDEVMLWNTSLASARYPFDFWADKLEKAEIHLLPQSDWLRDFLHKHLIYVAIILRMFRDTNLALSTSGVTSYTETECRDFVKHRIQPTHPLIARKILDKLFVQTG
ncbi:hypothetical protein JCM5353_000848 [Sporobolomyces roseus]